MTQECRWCTKVHSVRLMCGPARKILDALYARGMEGNMPTIEFPEPIRDAAVQLGLNPDDRLMSQVVIKAATVPLAGIARPALIVTGRDVYGQVLPQWMYAGDPDEIGRLVQLVTDTAGMATRAAAAANSKGDR